MTDRVAIFTPNPGHVAHEYAQSLVGLVDHDRDLIADVVLAKSGPALSHVRNIAVHQFLTHSEASWMLCLDADMQFPPDLVARLLAVADVSARPVLGANCAMLGRARHEFMQPVPTTFRLDAHSRLRRFTPTAGDGPVVQVDATGAACLLIHRRVLASMQLSTDLDSLVTPWFGELKLAGVLLSEDQGFCVRAARCGVPLHVARGMGVGHVKSQVLDEPDWG